MAAVVAVTGPIGWIGLLAPHLSRRALRSEDPRKVLAFSALMGAALLTMADVGARFAIAPAETPVGLWTAVLGGPVLLLLLRDRILRSGPHAWLTDVRDATDGRVWGARRFSVLLAIVGLALIGVLFVVHLCTGTVRLGPGEVLASLMGRHAEDLHRTVVWDLRLPRSLIAIVAGALLGMAGAVLQVVMRNNLAEPGITGVTAGGILCRRSLDRGFRRASAPWDVSCLLSC